jgi:cell division septation protein DedD
VLASGSVVLIAIAVVLALSISSALATAQKQADAEAAAEAEAKAEAARLELLPAAVRSCGLDSSIVQDGGRSALLDNAGNDFGSGDLSVDDLICVLNAVDTPESVINHMSKTRSLDGTQSDTWGDFSATWTYHPDHGLDIILKLT